MPTNRTRHAAALLAAAGAHAQDGGNFAVGADGTLQPASWPEAWAAAAVVAAPVFDADTDAEILEIFIEEAQDLKLRLEANPVTLTVTAGADGAVEQARVEMGKAEALGQGPREGAFAGGRGAVYGDGEGHGAPLVLGR